jgi:S-formylglutathione hydrolase FrmB
LCIDSRRGNADTYLSQDVPRWVKQHLTVDDDPAHWAVAGDSYGGTCALQLATNHPEVYRSFIEKSGSREPTLGNRARTVAEGFNGDQAAFARVNPMDLLQTHLFPGSGARFVVGPDDRDAQADARAVYSAARAAGMDIGYAEVPGSHDWRCFTAALTLELPWLGQRMGLIT